MKSEILKLYKEEGETPLECLERFRREKPLYKDVKMTYLGRLDPMAEGVLLVLAGDTSRKNDYLGLDKTYEFEVLWGFETDTHDILGIPSFRNSELLALNPLFGGSDATPNSELLSQYLSKFIGKKMQQYPKYSSPRLYKVDESEIPTKEVEIYSLHYIGTKSVSGQDLLKDVEARIGKVRGDFRQKEILEKWQEILKGEQDKQFLISKFEADVSSGTYIRSLTHEMGQILGCGALAYSIKRIKVGDY